MSAIDNKHLLEIINVVEQKYEAKGERKGGSIFKAQCVFHGADSGALIGQLMLPKELKDTVAGRYLAEFELGVNYKLEVVPKIIALHVHSKAAAAAPATPAKSV